jgi:putative ABC transport system permease protein
MPDTMLLNYLKLAIRLLIRNPFFTFINVLGLSVGFAVFFILWQYTQTELAADQYHKDSDRIVRVATDWRWTDDGKSWGRILFGRAGSAVIHRVSQDFAEVESYLRVMHQPYFTREMTGHGIPVILAHEKINGSSVFFKEEHALYADPNLFDFFSIPLTYGESKNVLQDKNSIVLSQKTARKFFGDKNPVGELLILNGKESLKVTGVFEDLPQNTHLVFDFVISNRSRENEWNKAPFGGTHCYLKLRGDDKKGLENQINAKMPVYWAEVFRTLPHVKADVILQPLTDVAFNNEFLPDNFRYKSKTILIGLAAVSVIILLMAWANYINLSVSRTNDRIKEVATRKMSGAFSSDIIKQFVIESFLMNVLAALSAITLIQFVRQPSALLLDIYVPEITTLPAMTFLFFGTVIVLGIFLTALYPAVLSIAHNPGSLFSISKRSGKRLLPSVLTTFQYVVAVILIFAGLIIHQQLNYILNKDLGFKKEQVLMIDAPVVRSENYLSDLKFFENAISARPSVQNVSHQSGFINLSVKRQNKPVYINVDGYGVDENFLSLFDIHLVAGRNFESDDRADAIILSRFAVERLNFESPQAAVGSKIIAGPQDTLWRELEIIGVMENIKTTPFYSSPHNSEAETGRGVAYVYGSKAYSDFTPATILVRLDPKQQSVEDLEKDFSRVFPGNVFSSTFLNDQINNIYNKEKLIKNQLTFFTCLAIGIACLGLLGMICNKVVEKKKEIAIRKSMGAGLASIGNLLLRNTGRQILISFMLGIPVSYFLSHQYLQRFSDQISIQWWHFAAPIVLLVFIMLATISYVLAEVARANPVDSLRHP